MGFPVRGDGGFLAVRVPILSGVLLRRGDGGDCWRYGNDLGEYIISLGGPEGVSPVTSTQERLVGSVTFVGRVVWLLLRYC